MPIPNSFPSMTGPGRWSSPAKFGTPRTPKSKTERYPCDLLWTALYISAEGNVMYCCHDYKHSSRLSSVMDKDLLEIWTTEVSRERENHVRNVYGTDPCKDCSAWQTRPQSY